VFGKKSMRKISTFKFLFYKSALDILVLLFGATDIVVKNTLDFQIRINSNFLCKVHTFFTYFVTHASSLILMAVSIDRVIIMMNSNTLNSHLGNNYNPSSNKSRRRHLTTANSVLIDNSVETHQMNEIKDPPPSPPHIEPPPAAAAPIIKKRKSKKKSVKININAHSKILIESVSFNEIKEKLFWKRQKKNMNVLNEEAAMINDQQREQMCMEERRMNSNSNQVNKCTLDYVLSRFSVNRVVLLILLLLILMNIHYILFLKLHSDTDDKSVIDNLNLKLGVIRNTHKKKNISFSASSSSLASSSSSLMSSRHNIFNLTAQQILNSNLLDGASCYAQENSVHEYFLQKVWIWIDLSVYSLIPFCTNLVCSLLIIFKVRKLNRNYFQFLRNKDYEYNKKTYEKKIKKNNQICLMLLYCNLYFFISMLQFWIFFYFFKDTKDQIDDRVYLYVYIILYTNNAIDFIIYSFSSERYREEALSVCLFFKSNQPVVV
jgi:hypothetical protein